jgi:U3 small nucleolar RNA-associated protein 23
MIMEPMADATSSIREREERQKFKAGLRRRGSVVTGKRGRENDDEPDHFLGREGNALLQSVLSTAPAAEAPPAKKKKRGPKEPNPLSVKKPKPKDEPKVASTSEPLTEEAWEKKARKAKRDAEKWEARMAKRAEAAPLPVEGAVDSTDGATKRKRKHKPKPKAETTDAIGSAED